MRATSRWIGIVGVAAGVAACSSGRMVQVPPRVDLGGYGTVGLIELSSPQLDDTLRRQANREFLTAIQSAQPGVPVLELGEEARVLDGAEGGRLDPESMRAIGEKYRVDVILFGVLEAKEVRPKVSVGGGLESLKARAEIEGSLVAKMYDTRTGATLWTCAASDRRTMAAISVSSGGIGGAGARLPDETRSELVHALVTQATHDFRPTWMRVRD